MIPQRHQEFLDRVVPRIAAEERVTAVALSGSLAHGSPDAFSDVDLVLAVPDELHAAVMADRLSLIALMVPVLFGQPPVRRFLKILQMDGLLYVVPTPRLKQTSKINFGRTRRVVTMWRWPRAACRMQPCTSGSCAIVATVCVASRRTHSRAGTASLT